ncbi:AAA family ATPase [Pseudorhodoferax sp.]|uniref:AAA family ATPase n=1 Tax=Pseudorhodoferax sp. TaxID=1993553 RepID=UPI002DD625FD|nr:AAA family ATPase [Pseudorhodoferax sp.]
MTMRITRLRVEQLRRFRAPLELAGFAPGLNILAGPNEAGKSTLVRAIRAAFFERHKSSMVDDLRPWDEGSGAAPRVEIDFDLAGQPHHLVKSFLGKKRCMLAIGTRQLEGAEAEDHLAQLFGYAYSPKGASKTEHQGIPGLLWVEQGSGQELDVRHAREHLHDALQGQGEAAGALAATGGDALLERLRKDRAELLTGTGKPTGEHKQAIDAVAQHQADIAALDAQIAQYREQVDRLDQLRRAHAADASQQPWDALERELAQARALQATLDASARQLGEDRQRLADLTRTRELLGQRLAALGQQEEDLARRQAALGQAEAAAQSADAAAALARQQADAAQARAHTAQLQAQAAQQQALRDSLQQQLEQARTDAATAAHALQRAQAAHAELATQRAQAAALPPLTPKQLQQLRALAQAREQAALRHQAVATRLAWRLPDGQTLQLGAQPLQGGGELLLTAPALLRLPGGGELRITPGGQDLADLARADQQAQHQLQQALAALGLADLAEAEARLVACAAAQAAVQLAEQALAIVAPQGLDALDTACAQAQARIQAADAALARLPATPQDAAQNAVPAADATDFEKTAQQALSIAREAQAKALAQQAAASSRRDAARTELQAAQARLAAPERSAQQEAAQQQLLQAQAEHQALDARVAQTAASLQSARPDIVAQDIARLARSIEQLRAGHQQRHEQILVLQSALQQAGAQGLEEQRAALDGELQRAGRRQHELQRRAAALDLLCERLQARRQATLARLQAPLAQRLQHYLPLLLPGASMQIDEQLAPALLTRPRAAGAVEAGAVEALSFGAREQLGLISRFAYADLLQQAGRPTLLILDDALVHSDSARLGHMKRVLFDAAQRHQVLLFTCHPEVWRDMGVAVRSLDSAAG